MVLRASWQWLRQLSSAAANGASHAAADGAANAASAQESRLHFSLVRTFTPADVEHFLHMTGDNNPIHTDTVAATAAGFEGTIVPGILLASLFPALIGSAFPGAVYATQSLAFKAPALVGQPVEAVVQVIRGTPPTGKVLLETRCYAGKAAAGRLLVEGHALALLGANKLRQKG